MMAFLPSSSGVTIHPPGRAGPEHQEHVRHLVTPFIGRPYPHHSTPVVPRFLSDCAVAGTDINRGLVARRLTVGQQDTRGYFPSIVLFAVLFAKPALAYWLFG